MLVLGRRHSPLKGLKPVDTIHDSGCQVQAQRQQCPASVTKQHQATSAAKMGKVVLEYMRVLDWHGPSQQHHGHCMCNKHDTHECCCLHTPCHGMHELQNKLRHHQTPNAERCTREMLCTVLWAACTAKQTLQRLFAIDQMHSRLLQVL